MGAWAIYAIVGSGACAAEKQPYTAGTSEQRQELRLLWSEVNEHTLRTPRGLAALELYTQHLVASGRPDTMHRLLTQSVLNDPGNSYNAMILFLLAAHYERSGQPQMAAHYYRNIINNYRDVRYDNESVHLQSLIMLVKLTTDADKLAEYHRMLIYRFPEHIDIFVNFRNMIEQYRRTANWPLLFQSYDELVSFCSTNTEVCQSDSERIEYIDNVRAQMRFAESERYWSVSDLDLLVEEVKRALAAQSAARLLERQAGVNFFARSWEQEEFDFNSQINFNIGIFLRRSRVSFERTVDSSSNAQEAYLRTWGWSHRIPTWYFYFRKIDFPRGSRSTWELGMGRYIFWRAPLGCALITSALLYIPCIVTAQADDTAQKTEISVESDWKSGVITFTLRESITPYAQQGYDAPAYQANLIWQTEFDRIITDVLGSIPYSGTENLLSEAKRRGISRRVTEDLAQSSKLIYNGLSEDFTAVEGRFRLRLYPEITSLFPLAARAVEERAAWAASANYSGVVIIAQGALPIHNDTASTSARPTLSPVIYDEQLLTVLHPAMVEGGVRERHGVVGYDSEYTIDEWRWRVGNTPLLIYARGVTSAQGTDIIISSDDARRLLTREHNRNLLRNGGVLVILDNIITNNLLTVRVQ